MFKRETVVREPQSNDHMLGNSIPQHVIDPMDPINHGKPLWVVYGHECAPSLMCCKLLAYTSDHQLLPIGTKGTNVVIWGHSVYRNKPGFRTLGQNIDSWAGKSIYGPYFFESQKNALEEICRITTNRSP